VAVHYVPLSQRIKHPTLTLRCVCSLSFRCCRLLVKEQAKRMKLADVPKHPWIMQYTQSAGSSSASSSTHGILNNNSSSQVR
jgi:hypothetical protein